MGVAPSMWMNRIDHSVASALAQSQTSGATAGALVGAGKAGADRGKSPASAQQKGGTWGTHSDNTVAKVNQVNGR